MVKKKNKVKVSSKSKEKALMDLMVSSKYYHMYEEIYSISPMDQVDIDEAMRTDDKPVHYFGVKYPGIEKGFIVFENMLPSIGHEIFAKMKFRLKGSRKEFADLLPNYRILIIKEDQPIPTEEETKVELLKFIDLWIRFNTIQHIEDELKEAKNVGLIKVN